MTLTQKDLDEIEVLVGNVVEEKTKNLPTKDEFFTKMDEVVGELKTSREEQAALSHQVSNHDDRITKLEEAHT